MTVNLHELINTLKAGERPNDSMNDEYGAIWLTEQIETILNVTVTHHQRLDLYDMAETYWSDHT